MSGGSGWACRNAGGFRTPSSSCSIRNWRRCSRPDCRSCNRWTFCAGACRIRCSRPRSTTSTSEVRSGSALSDAFEAQRLFPAVYTASLMAGEKSGSLEVVIRRYVQHIKVLKAVRSTWSPR